MTEDRLDSRSSFEPFSDRTGPGFQGTVIDNLNLSCSLIIVTTVPPVNRSNLGLPPAQIFNLVEPFLERVAVIRVIVQRPDAEYPVALGTGEHADFAAKFIAILCGFDNNL